MRPLNSFFIRRQLTYDFIVDCRRLFDLAFLREQLCGLLLEKSRFVPATLIN